MAELDIPILDRDHLEVVLGSGPGSLADKINKEYPARIIRQVINDTRADSYYYSTERWRKGGGLVVKDLRKFFINKETDKILSSGVCLKLMNEYVVPLWNHVYVKNKHAKRKNPIKTVGDVFIERKGELMYLMWLVYNCAETPGLEVAITISPLKSEQSN